MVIKKFSFFELLICILYSFFYLYKVFIESPIISRSSENIIKTGLLLWGISMFHFLIANIHFKGPVRRLQDIIFGSVRLALYTLFVLSVVSHSGLVPGLSLESLRLQNAKLIDNQSDLSSIKETIALNNGANIESRMDLFYGEPSFLALVVFVLILCGFLTGHRREGNPLNFLLPIFAGCIVLLLTESLSAILYVLTIFLVLIYGRYVNVRFSRGIIRLSLVIIVSLVVDWDYLLYRIVRADQSVSVLQRYGWVFLNRSIESWSIFGLSEQALLPDFGIQNGIIYLFATAGIFGLGYMWILMKRLFLLENMYLRFLFIMVLVSFYFQNGAPFSLSKTFLILLIFVSLSIYQNKSIYE